MLIKTQRTTIRLIVADDWERLKQIWIDFNSSSFCQYDKPHITDDEFVRARILKWAEANKGLEHMFFAICVDNIVIGYCSFNKKSDNYEIGYCFHSAYHKKGYAKESLLALFNYFNTLNITKFTAGTALNNLPSVSLLKSLGFKLVQTENVSFYKDNQGNDIVFKGGIFELNLN